MARITATPKVIGPYQDPRHPKEPWTVSHTSHCITTTYRYKTRREALAAKRRLKEET